MTSTERSRAKRERDRLADSGQVPAVAAGIVPDRVARVIELQTGRSMAENAQRLGLTDNE